MDLRLPDLLAKVGIATREQAEDLRREIEQESVEDYMFPAIPPPDDKSLRGPGRTLSEF